MEPDWSFTPPGLPPPADYTTEQLAQDMVDGDETDAMALVHSATLDQLAGSLADELSLQGSVFCVLFLCCFCLFFFCDL